ncbi:hypothetical protein GF343_02730 [Candidatus Woesearchaeota archaeon]|nr:hypothetical protein [Candidatus Woesearchaeota archaeon]
MIFSLVTLGDNGLLAKIEAKQSWDAFNILADLLDAFYAGRGAVLEKKDFNEAVVSGDKRKWSLAVVYQGREYGKINLTYLGSSPRFKLGKHWDEHELWVYFEFNTPGISARERERFRAFV